MIKDSKALKIDNSKKMNVADRNEIDLGEAYILSNVEGECKEYKIEIQRTYLNNNYDNKSMLIKVIDEELLSKTGGIIQGMSGSPIIQNGKFCGAITHVLVQKPDTGYAVFADLMIKQMRTVQ
jgi:stage IV sporulation protein B